MATQTVSPPPAPSAQVVGNAFVEKYYHILHQSPELVHRFYHDTSVLSRPDPNGLMTTVTTMKSINDKICSLDYNSYKAEIKTADAQDSYKDGVIVLVTGCLTGKDNLRRKFTQTFFLAPQYNGYYVKNDIFRYVDESEADIGAGTVIGVDDTPSSSLTQGPEPVQVVDPPNPNTVTSHMEEIEIMDDKANDQVIDERQTYKRWMASLLKNRRTAQESKLYEETVSSDAADVSSNRASSKLPDERSGSLVRLEELEMKMCPRESEHRPPADQKAGGNAKFENESNEVNFENIVVDGATRLCSFDVMAAECLPEDLDQFPNTAPTTASRKKLLVLDVNGLLAHIVMPAPKDCGGDVYILGRAIFKRPFCDDFLKFCFQNFDVGIWSSRTKKIIDRVVNYLLGDLKDELIFCWDMSHSTQSGFTTLENTNKPLVCKELRKIWENDDPKFPWKKGDYDESNTLLLDDSPYKALLNPLNTAIFPPSYHYTDKEDDSIGPGGDLRVYLEGLFASANVREYVEHHAFGQSAINETNVSWQFYSRVLHAMSNKLGNNHPVPRQL